MKIAKLRFDYILLIYVPFALVGVLLSVFCQHAIITLLKIAMPLALLAAFICSALPIGGLKLLASAITTNAQRHWFIKLISLQSSVFFIFIAFAQAVFQLMINNHTSQTHNSLIRHTLNFYQGGLWPWPFILLISCALAYLGRQEKQPALLRKAVQPIIKQQAVGIIGTGIEIFLKQSLLFSALLTIGILSLELANQLAQFLHLPSLLTFSLANLSISVIILLLFSKNFFTRYLTRNLWRQRYSDKKLILIFCCSVVLILIMLDYLMRFCIAYFLPKQTINIVLTLFNTYKNIDCWYLLSFIWWIGIIPPLARRIALLGSGQSLRKLLTAGLLLPLIFFSAWRLNDYLPSAVLCSIGNFINSWPVVLFVSVLGLIATVCLFQNPTFCKITTENSKQHTNSAVSFLRNLWQLCTAILTVYMLANVYLLTYLGAALAAPVFVTLFCAVLSGCMVLFRQKFS